MWFLRLCTVCAWLNHYAQSLPLCNLYWGRRCSFCLLHPRTMGMFFVVIIIYSNIRCKVMQSKVKISSTQQEKQIAKPIAVWSIHNSFVLKLLFIFLFKSSQNNKWRFRYWYTSKTDKIESHAPYPRTISGFCKLCLSTLETKGWNMKDNSRIWIKK